MNTRRILITGASGQLGRTLLDLPAGSGTPEWIATDFPELDITDRQAVANALERFRPDALINCAAFTAVDAAETEYPKAFSINALGPENLAIEANLRGILFIHISTDYVFSGEQARPYRETDAPEPRSAYGKSKLEGENRIRSAGGRAIILRTSWLYSETGRNFFLTMLRLAATGGEVKVVFDQTGSPTYAGDLAAGILKVTEHAWEHPGWPEKPELYHFSNAGTASWYDFAVAIAETAGLPCQMKPIRTEEYPVAAPRPAFSVLDTGRFREFFGFSIPHWQRSLKTCFEHYQESKQYHSDN